MSNVGCARVAAVFGTGKTGRKWLHLLLLTGLALAGTNAIAQSCTVASGGTLAFQAVVALASTVNQTTDSGQSFKVKCDILVLGTLRLYSTTQRVMRSSSYSLPFNLSLNSGAASDDLPTAGPGAQFNITRDGIYQPVTLYAKIFTQDFKSLPGGSYSSSITLTVEY
ncbi:MAG: spore coat protein U domain-containing protein [Burkholderiaceae bacterium]|nr:spore coat protein U domain-containing protein [Burkholderiaceae bacterium]